MTTNLKIHELALTTADGTVRYEFSTGLNTITGPVGSGKSSLLELIRYCLGGRGVLSTAVTQAVQRVVLRAEIGDDTYRFARNVGQSQVSLMADDGSRIAELTTTGSKTDRRISTFLLDAAHLPEVRLARRGGGSERLGFADFLNYSYVSQPEIDRSVVRHLDPLLDRRRKKTFEVLFGLVDEAVSALEISVNELTEELKQSKQRQDAVLAFLQSLDAADSEALLLERAALELEEAEHQAKLESLRVEVKTLTAQAESQRQQLAELAAALGSAARDALTAQGELQARQQLLAEVELDFQKLDRVVSASSALHGLEFVQCPRCLQTLASREPNAESCYLCGQPDLDAGADTDDVTSEHNAFLESERGRIEVLHAEILELVAADAQALDEAIAEQERLERSVSTLESDIDARTAEFVSPRFEAIADASARRASIEQRLAAVASSLQQWDAYRNLAGGSAQLEQDLAEARQELAQGLARLDSRRGLLPELSNLFDELVQFLQVPWYQSASIDPKNYLPVVNGASFEALSSGGMKTLVNIAYHLALLTFGLSRPDTLLSSLLIIDSPRKNLGKGDYDQEHAVRMYRRLSALVATYGSGVQVIVADNDPPPSGVIADSQIVLSYEAPLVPGLAHPGPAVEGIYAED